MQPPTIIIRSVIALSLWIMGGLFSCQSTSSEKWVVGFSQCVDNDAWRQAMLGEMRKELAFYPELQLIYKNADGSSQQQLRDIQALMSEGIDILIISPNEAAPITPLVEEIYHSGIPVIVVDRKIASKTYTAFVGGDNYEIGRIAGKYAASLLSQGGNILEVTGLPGSTPAQERHQGFINFLEGFPNLYTLDTINGEWERDVARRKLQDSLQYYPNVDLIFAHNDMMALAAREVLRQQKGSLDIKVLGVDGIAGPGLGLDMVNQGTLDATFMYPTGGDKAIQVARNILTGRPYEKENILQTTVIDSSNVKVIKLQSDKILEQQQEIVRQQHAIKEQLSIYRSQRTLLYAVIISLASAIALGAYALYSLREKQLTNQQLKAQNEKITEQRNQIMKMAQETEEANQAKFQFFTNISHEFRTPLTLILASVDDMLEESQVSSIAMKQDLRLMHKNASRLLRLINQLLDFRRLEHNKIKVKVSKGDLVAFLREVYTAFERTAYKREMDFQFIALQPVLEMHFDASMLDKVFFNLLSNAFKFTPDGGKIQVIIEKDTRSDSARIRVIDNGRGMAAEHASHAFDRFYQGEQYQSMGTGLGLSLSKELIELHGGTISVASEKGMGASFDILLPLNSQQWADHEMTNSPQTQSSNQYFVEDVGTEEEKDTVAVIQSKADNTILVIEDNEDLRHFLVRKLQQKYQVVASADGTDGLAQAFAQVPDLIVSDVMLPGADGLIIAKTLKNDLRTSHIPIILLTARSSPEQQIEGIKTGVDAYVVKPFHTTLLLEQIDKLLWNREQLRQRFAGATDESILAHPSMPDLDQQFLARLSAIIQQHLSDPELSVNAIAKELGLSRVQLYRKVKALLGIGINDHVKIQRLKKAKELLHQPDLTIAEVAYAVGFSSPAYFSTVFKSYYEQSPSDFVRSHPSIS
uniref:histidine kinase n=1 Tax=Roseihalotalea indica TaxID=2867963 RepID=A0AA49JHT9_9BACT|nr:substrate-binding domain-containing protein [Tunicatimonas sp. TK19036]